MRRLFFLLALLPALALAQGYQPSRPSSAVSASKLQLPGGTVYVSSDGTTITEAGNVSVTGTLTVAGGALTASLSTGAISASSVAATGAGTAASYTATGKVQGGSFGNTGSSWTVDSSGNVSASTVTASTSVQTPQINGAGGNPRILLPTSSFNTFKGMATDGSGVYQNHSDTSASISTGGIHGFYNFGTLESAVSANGSYLLSAPDVATICSSSARCLVGYFRQLSDDSGNTRLNMGSSSSTNLFGATADGSSAVGAVIGNITTLATTGAKALSVRAGSASGTEVATLVKDSGGWNWFTGELSLGAKLTKYANVSTAGMGVSPIYAYGSLAGATTTGTAITSFTPAAQGLFEVGGSEAVTAWTSGNNAINVAYTDCQGNSRNYAMWGATNTGASNNVLAATGTLNLYAETICANAAAITLQTQITGTATVSDWAWIRQVN